MNRTDYRKRNNDKWNVEKYKSLHYDMKSIIVKYFMQDTYYIPDEPDIMADNQKYTKYCTNRDCFYNYGGLLL